MISDRDPALKPAEAREPGSQDAVFRLQKVSKVYRMGESEIHALRDVDLDLHPGEFIALLVTSGSGKSTLLNTLCGLDRPTSGQVRARGRNVATSRGDATSN